MMIAPFWFYETITQGSDLFKTEVFWVAISALGTVGLFLFVLIGFRKEMKQNREIRTLESRPFVYLSFEQNELGEVFLELKNYGKLPAYDIHISIGDLDSALWKIVEKDKLGKLSEVSWFTKPIGMLAPGQSIKLLYTTYIYLTSEHRKDHTAGEVRINYKDANQNKVFETPEYELNPDILTPLALRTIRSLDTNIGEINSSIRSISKYLIKRE